MKSSDKRTMLEMFDVIPTLNDVPGFRELVDRLPDDLDLDLVSLQDLPKADLEAIQEEASDPEFWTLPPAAARVAPARDCATAPTKPTKSKPITIRIPSSILRELRVAARAKGIGYQTMLVRMLRGSLPSC